LLFTIDLGAAEPILSHNDNSGDSLTVILLPWQPQFYYGTTFSETESLEMESPGSRVGSRLI